MQDMSKAEATRLADALCSEPVNSIDAAQRRGHLGSPSEWRNACRLFRARCSPEDASRMARLRAYIEDGLLEVVRPTAPPGQSERIAALESAREVQDAALVVARSDFKELALRAEKLEAALEQARVAMKALRSVDAHSALTEDDADTINANLDAALRAIEEVRRG